MRTVVVIDIGKTNAKLALVDLGTLAEVAVRSQPNVVRGDGPYPHHDVELLWDFVCDGLAALGRERRVEAIVTTTHGATAALVGAEDLVLPVLDYEHDGPARLAAEYDAMRPDFAETGSPRMARGLNLGAQIFWQARQFPEAFGGLRHILPWPQYWAYRLSGVRACELTSLGAHTDLWDPWRGALSSLVDRLELRGRLAPLRRPADVLGPVRPELAARLGLDPATPVLCGIHDSNASLVPHLLARPAPFTVVSTGTWVVSLAVGGRPPVLDPARNTLVNVSALGTPVPSATFMGGREFARTVPEGAAEDPAALGRVLAQRIMLMPGLSPGTGPFPAAARARWSVPPETLSPAELHAVVSLYLGLMTETCLAMIGADGPLLIEGPFARNLTYARALAALTGRPVLPQRGSATGTSAGAALLATMRLAAPPGAQPVMEAGPEAAAVRAYAAAWREET